MPNNPNVAARNMSGKRSIRTEIAMLIAGITKLLMAVMETTIIIAEKTIPAPTAARLSTSTPTIEIAHQMARGIHMRDSGKISPVSSTKPTSINLGTGVTLF